MNGTRKLMAFAALGIGLTFGMAQVSLADDCWGDGQGCVYCYNSETNFSEWYCGGSYPGETGGNNGAGWGGGQYWDRNGTYEWDDAGRTTSGSSGAYRSTQNDLPADTGWCEAFDGEGNCIGG